MVGASEMLAALCGSGPEQAVAASSPVPFKSFEGRSLRGGGSTGL